MIFDKYSGSTGRAAELPSKRRDLQHYLAENLECIESGLKLYDVEGIRPIEFEAGGGLRIDILVVEKTEAFVVLELKVSKAMTESWGSFHAMLIGSVSTSPSPGNV